MKAHRILKDFNGSQTGHDFHVFKAGSTVHLSTDLAAIATREGWAEQDETKPVVQQAAVEVPEVQAEIPAETRESKIVEPDETKPKHPNLKRK